MQFYIKESSNSFLITF